jgi:putative transposase
MQELSGVSEAARDLAMSRFRLIQPYLEERRSLQLVAAEANLSFRTAQRFSLDLQAFLFSLGVSRGDISLFHAD